MRQHCNRSRRAARVCGSSLKALETELLTAELADAFAAEFARETARLAKSLAAGDNIAVARLKVVDAELANLSANLTAGAVGPTIMKLLADREAEQAMLVAKIENVAKPPAPILLPRAALLERYAVKVADLRDSLSQPGVRTEAAQILQDLLESVTILSDALGGPQAEIDASPATLIAYAGHTKAPPGCRRGW